MNNLTKQLSQCSRILYDQDSLDLITEIKNNNYNPNKVTYSNLQELYTKQDEFKQNLISDISKYKIDEWFITHQYGQHSIYSLEYFQHWNGPSEKTFKDILQHNLNIMTKYQIPEWCKLKSIIIKSAISSIIESILSEIKSIKKIQINKKICNSILVKSVCSILFDLEDFWSLIDTHSTKSIIQFQCIKCKQYCGILSLESNKSTLCQKCSS